MKITDVRVKLMKKNENRLKAVASVIFDDCFALHDIKIIEGEKEFFIAMPSKKMPGGDYKDIAHPINTETREMMKEPVLEAFKNELANADAASAQENE